MGYQDCVFSHLHLSKGEALVSLGEVVTTESHPWWKVDEDGTVFSAYDDGHNIRATVRYVTDLVNGDKLSTSHGQKGVAVITDEMPVGMDIKR